MLSVTAAGQQFYLCRKTDTNCSLPKHLSEWTSLLVRDHSLLEQLWKLNLL